MSAQESPELHIRLARADDDEFIVGLAPRFAEFDLPVWRKPKEVIGWIHDDLLRTATSLPPGRSWSVTRRTIDARPSASR